MRAMFVLPGAALALGLFAAGASLASAATDDAGKCSVTVDRSGGAGSLDVTKQSLDGGSCVCYVTTGAEPDSEENAKKIAYLQSSGKCGSGENWPLYVLGAGAGVGGIIAAVSSSNNDSTGG
jgi:hypothetical protein